MSEHRAIDLGLLILCGLGCASALSPTINQIVSIAFAVLLGLVALVGVVQLVRHHRNYEQYRRTRRSTLPLLDDLVGDGRP